jgi:putative PIN family toxin of toxin-antitoxin system
VRLVLDTSVLVAAVRSPNGASGLLVDDVFHEIFRPLVSVPLVLEYEAILTRPEHLKVAGLTRRDAVKIVKAFCRMGQHVHLAYRLRPQLPDPDDEFVLDTAVHGKADAILTFNRQDFLAAANRFSIDVILPGQALKRMRTQ